MDGVGGRAREVRELIQRCRHDRVVISEAKALKMEEDSRTTRISDATCILHAAHKDIAQPSNIRLDRDKTVQNLERFKARVEKAIVRVTTNKDVVTDGLHIEMVKADPSTCATILAAWWGAVRRMAQFRIQWEGGILCPLYINGTQDDPVKYILVCILSHAGKKVDSAPLSYACEHFTPTRQQFGFKGD